MGSAPRSSLLRLLAALGLFVGALAGGVYVLVVRDHLGAPGFAAQPPAREEGPFFYRTLGAGQQVKHLDNTGKAASGNAPGERSSYTLELQVAGSKSAAEQATQELHEQGVDAYYTPLAREGRVVYRVREGIFSSEKEADRGKLALKKKHGVEGKVVKLQ